MRVISGRAKGTQLSSVPGKSTRPITDRVKEALFNILGPEIYNKTILDLFGGTGAVGIEALSRGADHVVFIEINYRAYKTIKKNLKAADLELYATVIKKDAFVYLREESNRKFDMIYIAPPQYQELWVKAMQILDENPEWLKEDGIVIVQIHPKEDNQDIDYANFNLYDKRNYGDTRLIFYERISTK
jgi:16S rRNA (guanine966-N2)-methyltransferase